MNPADSSAPARPRRRPFYVRLIGRRALLAYGIAATTIAIFYTEENWHGKRAWEQYRQEAKARGETVDWAAYVPAPVPDDQNIFKAPRMQEWFVGRGFPELEKRWAAIESNWQVEKHPAVPANKTVLVAVVSVVPTTSASAANNSDATWRMDDPALHQLADKLIRDTIGPSVAGATGEIFVARSLDQIRPVRIFLQADRPPTVPEIALLFPGDAIPPSLINPSTRPLLQVDPVGDNSFEIRFTSPAPRTAADYLEMTAQFEPDLAVIREALKRPYSRPEGNYDPPATMPIPNFAMHRFVVQRLAQMTQCHLLLARPNLALQDMTLLHDFNRLMEATPPGRPLTLVAGMINIAETGVYLNTIADGLRWQAWHEPQLIALQKQLAEIDLVAIGRQSFEAERAASARSLETIKPKLIADQWLYGGRPTPGWQKMVDPKYLFLTLAPRGWWYQNMVAAGPLAQTIIDGFDQTNGVFLPGNVESWNGKINSTIRAFSPYTFALGYMVPNFTRATQAIAFAQARVNEAQAACALERYRLAHAEYPETLDSLVPQFIEKLPHDVIGGQPLKYRRAPDGQFVLYSVGWNGKDDGGVPGKTQTNPFVTDNGDWVWPMRSP